MSADYRELLGRALVEIRDLKARVRGAAARPADAVAEAIAIQGLAARFPGAPDLDGFARLLAERRSGLRDVPAERWDVERWYDPDPDAPGRMYVRRAGFLDAVDRFDAALFRISRREAEGMDPQQRLLLEVTWSALEDAGLSADALVGSRTGVFVGLSGTEYAQIVVQSGVGDAHSGTGVVASVAAGRIAYVLGLRGPTLVVDTACSSSLVALHLACASLRARECDRAIVAGVNVLLTPESMVSLCRSRALAPDGLCKTFDARADGYARSEGCGALVLARAADLKPGRDRVRAIVRGTAVNHDGRSSGLSVPNGPAQEEVLRAALANAGVAPSSVSYVEAHGTGTALGDPIELAALASVYGAGRAPEDPLLVGSVKTNIGHLEAAAGVAGVMKVVLALEAGTIPAHLHFERPTPHVPWDTLPLRVTAGETSWPRGDKPRRAGVSAFGFSGTNAHAVIEEAPALAERRPMAARPLLVALSSHTPAALDAAADHLAAHLDAVSDRTLADVAYTLGAGRAGLRHRLAVVGAERAEIAAALRDKRGAVRRGLAHDRPRLAFLFAGQGSQRAGMGRELWESEPVYRETWQRCAEAARPHLARDLTEVVWEGGPLGQTEWTQPAVVALELSLAALLRSFGLSPDAVLGHSIGELAAAGVAGVMGLEEVMRLACERGRAMAGAPRPGAMAAVFAKAEDVSALVAPHAAEAAIAAWNAADECVIAGETGAVAAIEAEAGRAGWRTRRLDVSQAFHSPLMDGAARTFTAAAGGVALARPACAFVSGVTGELVSDEVTHAEYWGRQLREGVRFRDGVRTLAREGFRVFVELGPGGELSALALRNVDGGRTAAVALLRRGHGDRRALAAALAELYAAGVSLDFDGVFRGEDVRRVSVPGTVFERERFWVKAERAPQRVSSSADVMPGRRVESPGRESLFEACWGVGTLPLLGDHRLYGRVVVPAAAHVARVVAALGAEGAHEVELEDVEFPEPLVLDEDENRDVVLMLRAEGAARVFEIASRAEGAGWAVHARGRVGVAASTDVRIDLDGIRRRCARELGGAELYAAIDATGAIELGPSFRRIESVHAGEREALARLRGESAPPRPHPGVLDAAFQSLNAALGAQVQSGEDTFVPFGFRRLVMRVEAAPVFVHAVVEPGAGPDGLVGTLSLADATGRRVAELSGLAIRRAPRDALLRAARRESATLFETAWRKVARPSGRADRAAVLIGGAGEADALAAAIAGRDARVSRWNPQQESISAAWARVAADADPTHVVLVAPAAERDALDLAAFEAALAPALALAQEAARRGGARRLTFVTAGAPALGEEVPRPEMAAVWGFAQSLALEHPELGVRLVDAPSPADADALAEAVLAADAEDRLAVRRGEWFAPRLVERRSAAADVTVRGDRTILVTGGLGALGREIAAWLAGRGARHLLLAGRGEPSAPARELARTLEAQGVTVRVARLDVADASAVGRLIEEAERSGPPLGGVVHLAGVLDDGLVAGQSWPRLSAVLAGKTLGAHHLDRATRSRALDFFVLASSLAGVLGSPGQSGYAAANAALDAIAVARRRAGRPALAVSFGPWAGPGMAERVARAGRMAPPTALAGLSSWMAAGVPHGIVAPLAEILPPDAAARPFLSEALRRRNGAAEEAAGEWRRRVTGAPEVERVRVLAAFVRDRVRHVLGVGTQAPLDDERPLSELGFDSLMALELRNALARGLDVSLPVTLLFDHPTTAAVTTFLAATLGLTEPSAAPVRPEPARAAVPVPGPAIDDLSDAEVEVLLAEKLRALQGGV